LEELPLARVALALLLPLDLARTSPQQALDNPQQALEVLERSQLELVSEEAPLPPHRPPMAYQIGERLL
jgi:hypothetical protein